MYHFKHTPCSVHGMSRRHGQFLTNLNKLVYRLPISDRQSLSGGAIFSLISRSKQREALPLKTHLEQTVAGKHFPIQFLEICSALMRKKKLHVIRINDFHIIKNVLIVRGSEGDKSEYP